MKLYTLKIYPEGWGRHANRVVEAPETMTLRKLCEMILVAFDFDESHMYEFLVPDCIEMNQAAKTTLKSLDLSPKSKIILHYDFGDDWMFIINVQKVQETTKAKYRIVSSKGEVPQYPDDEEEDW